MARYNEINVGRFNRYFQKLSGVKGGAPVPSLGDTLQPTLNPRSGSEDLYLQSWNLFGAQQNVAAGANSGQVQLRNPAGSNVMATFFKIYVALTGAVAGDVEAWYSTTNTADLASSGAAPVSLDSRGKTGSALIVSFTAASAIPAAFSKFMRETIIGAAGGGVDFLIHHDMEIPLLPGSTILVDGASAAVVINVTWLWAERYLEESERT